jgi:hypothetical protein
MERRRLSLSAETSDSSAPRCAALDLYHLVAIVVIGALVAMAATIMLIRAMYPYDLYIWAESPFLTNMLKIRAAQHFYGPISDANSFVYPPGMEMLHTAILAPFGLALSASANRLLVLLYGGLTAYFLTAALREMVPLCTQRALIAFGVLYLTQAAGTTSDTLHPDNIHILLHSVVFWLTLRALRGSLRAAVCAIFLGGVAVYFKQTAALLGAGSGLCIAALARTDHRVRIAAPIVGISLTALSLTSLLRNADAKEWVLSLMASHPVTWWRLSELRLDLIASPLGFAVATAALVACSRLFATKRDAALTWLVFLGISCFGWIAYLKAMGAQNNLTLCRMMLMVGALAFVLEQRPRVAAALATMLALGVVPVKALPTADLYRYGNEVQRAMDEAVRNGERVLLAHGTAWLVKAGALDVPLDRANSILEVNVARREADLGTLQRIRERYYDRIFINSPWYGPVIEGAIQEHYQKAGEIPFGQHPHGGERGFQGLFYAVQIYVKKP